jgi:hypothetical protein
VKINFVNNRFSPFARGPNKSINTNFTHKVAKIVGCEIDCMESCDEFNILDLPKIVKDVKLYLWKVITKLKK